MNVLTLEDIDTWDPQAIVQVYTTVMDKSLLAEEMKSNLGTLPIWNSWSGVAQETAYKAMGITCNKFNTYAQEMTAVARACDKAIWPIRGVKEQLASVRRQAEDLGIHINPDGQITIPNMEGWSQEKINNYMAKAHVIRTVIDEILQEAHDIDQQLADDITLAMRIDNDSITFENRDDKILADNKVLASDVKYTFSDNQIKDSNGNIIGKIDPITGEVKSSDGETILGYYDSRTGHITSLEGNVIFIIDPDKHIVMPQLPPAPATNTIIDDEDWAYGSWKYANIFDEFFSKLGAQEDRFALKQFLLAYWEGDDEAIAGLEHFLDNTGTDFTIPTSKVDEWLKDNKPYGSKSPAQGVRDQIREILSPAAEQAKKTGKNVPIYSSHDWTVVGGNGNDDEHNLLGHYSLSVSIAGEVYPDGTYHIRYQPHIFDRYNYGHHDSLSLERAEEAQFMLHKLEAMGWARNFDIYGTGSVHEASGRL